MKSCKFPYERILVVGATGSGKSTLARELAAKLRLEYIELDALYWAEGWSSVPNDVFRERVERASAAPRWVSAGNYRFARDILWPRAQAAIWLDYPLSTVFGQLARRTWQRWRTQEELWNGNRENFWVHFMVWSDRSLFGWLARSHGRLRREYPLLFTRPENLHLHVIRFGNPAETQEWLQTLGEVALEI